MTSNFPHDELFGPSDPVDDGRQIVTPVAGAVDTLIPTEGGMSIVLSLKWPWYAGFAQGCAQFVARICVFFGLPYMWAARLAGSAIIAGAKFSAERQ
jgi:hypothetical protein